MTWNLDQIERELQHGDPCHSVRLCHLEAMMARGTVCCDDCAARAPWLAQSLRLPGALIRHLLGGRPGPRGAGGCAGVGGAIQSLKQVYHR
jgi:hypothetical protein